MAYTEFYCNFSTGSNFNAGSTTGAPTVEATAGTLSSLTFTAGSGTPWSGVEAGWWASIYQNGVDTVAKAIGRVSSVGGGGASITVVSWLGGTPTGSEDRLVVGGVWKGPNAAEDFPFGVVSGSFVDASGNQTRVNFKNTAEYDISAGISTTTSGPILYQGYTTTLGDGGKAVIDAQNNGVDIITLTTAKHVEFADFELKDNDGSGTGDGFYIASGSVVISRCVMHHIRYSGIHAASGSAVVANECESYLCNVANTSLTAAGYRSAGSGTFVRCTSHTHSAANGLGFISAGNMVLDRCISHHNTSHGAYVIANASLSVINTDIYYNGGSGISSNDSAHHIYIENSNLVRNGAYGIVVGSNCWCRMWNCGGYGNTSGFSSGNTNASGTVTYAGNTEPWTDPETGDFTITTAAAMATGRGAFTQTDGTYSGAVGYPDIGSNQSLAVTLDYPAETDVRYGVTYANTVYTGSCYVPAAADVEFGVDVDDTTGLFVVPAEEDVETGVTYGASAEFTGTLTGGGGDWTVEQKSDIMDAVAAINACFGGTDTLDVNVTKVLSEAVVDSGTIDANLTTIKDQTVTCAAGVTVGAYVGNATAALSVNASGHVTPANASITADKFAASSIALDAIADDLMEQIPADVADAMLTGSIASVTGSVNSVATAVSADVVKIGGQDVTCAAPVTVGAYVGNATAALGVNASGHVTLADSSLTTGKLGTFALAKTTNITGFNDIAATDIVSGGAITTSSGSVSSVTTVGSVTGAVGSVTGSVGSVTGAVGSVTAGVALSASGLTAVQNGVLSFRKNVAHNNFGFTMKSATDHISYKADLTVTAQRSIDGAAFAACTNDVVEIAYGAYKINLAQADLNGDNIILRFSAEGADPIMYLIITQP